MAATIKEAVDIYDTFDSRYMGTGSDKADDLVMKWGAFEQAQNMTNLEKVYGAFDDIFMNRASIAHLEFCDYIDQVKPYGGEWEPLEKIAAACNTASGVYGVDVPQELYDSMLSKVAESAGDVIILNGDFVGHDRPAGKNELDIEVKSKWKTTKGIMEQNFAAMRS